MSRKTFTCGYCFAFYIKGEGCGCKDAQLDRAKVRIEALEGVVETTRTYTEFRRVGYKGHKSELIIIAKETDLFEDMTSALAKLEDE